MWIVTKTDEYGKAVGPAVFIAKHLDTAIEYLEKHYIISKIEDAREEKLYRCIAVEQYDNLIEYFFMVHYNDPV